MEAHEEKRLSDVGFRDRGSIPLLKLFARDPDPGILSVGEADGGDDPVLDHPVDTVNAYVEKPGYFRRAEVRFWGKTGKRHRWARRVTQIGERSIRKD